MDEFPGGTNMIVAVLAYTGQAVARHMQCNGLDQHTAWQLFGSETDSIEWLLVQPGLKMQQ